MSSSTVDIESIVREVIRRLTVKANGQPAGVGTEKKRNAETGTMCLTDRVVTLAQLEGSLDGVNQLIVLPSAVVTPAVQDELRRNGVALRRDAEQSESDGENDLRWRVLVGSDETGIDLRSLTAKKLPANHCDVELIEPGDVTRLLQEIAEQIHVRHTLGLIVSHAPHVVACQANRNPVFRAAVACDASEATERVEPWMPTY